MNVIEKSCAPSDRVNNWNSIDWESCQKKVRKLQVRLVKAHKEQRHNKVKALQWLLTHSFFAKALAVKRVTLNNGKNMAGAGEVFWSTPRSKFRAIIDLKRRGYNPQPLNQVNNKKNKRKNLSLKIPTIIDRAMQALYLMALEPIWETLSGNHFNGFSRAKISDEAKKRCIRLLSRKCAPEWVLVASVKGRFDHNGHEWLLDNVPTDKIILQKWLKRGYASTNCLFPIQDGSIQCGNISPMLINIAFYGLRTMLANRFEKTQVNLEMNFPRVPSVRNVVDFLVNGDSKEQLEFEVLPMIKAYLADRGLHLTKESLQITHINEGFDFLDLNIRRCEEGKLLTMPSKASLKRISDKISRIVHLNRASNQEILIKQINPEIIGWVNNSIDCFASKNLKKVDLLVFQKLRSWALRRHPKKAKYWIFDRYFRKINNRKWCFVADTPGFKGKNQLLVLKSAHEIKSLKRIQIKQGDKSFHHQSKPYFQRLKEFKMQNALKGEKLQAFWMKQAHRFVQRNRFNDDEECNTSKRMFVEGIHSTSEFNPCTKSHDQFKLKLP